MIIYPPYIADTIPAFTKDIIKIPFSQNPAVSIDEVTCFQIQIKDYVSGELIGTIKSKKETDNYIYNADTKSGMVIFHISDLSPASAKNQIVDKQYYKFQMSYSDSVEYDTAIFNAFSTASLGRCLGQKAPTIEIKGRQKRTLATDSLNIASSSFTGIYTSEISSEPAYNYRFYIIDTETQDIVQDSGVQLNNVDLDTFSSSGDKRYSQHSFALNYELEQWKRYAIVYDVTTISGYELHLKCPLIKAGELPIAFEGAVNVGQDESAKENGYVQIKISGRPVKGNFELQRTSDHKHWYTLTSFDLTELSEVDSFTWKDWSVEQGVVYYYAIRQQAQGQYSERLESAPIQIEFEHLFLSDGERQLKIAYNPKVSSIKDVILENKMDTIGNKYPFFFRNETVRYKELPISGLISYLTDDNELFMTNNELGLSDPTQEANENDLVFFSSDQLAALERPRTTNLTSYNFEAERKFKFAVLDWLNNGLPKLFRSPAEGNYIVRTTNVSLSPNEQVGRMLHSFSSTAYEIMEHSMENLQNNSIINLPYLTDPEPKKAILTLSYTDLTFDEDGYCDILTLLNSSKRTVVPGTMMNIVWYSAAPNYSEFLVIDGNKYYNNNSGIFKTPNDIRYTNIKVKKPEETWYTTNMASSITLEYIPDLTEAQGVDSFETMVATSDDVLFTVPSGQYLRFPYGSGALYVQPGVGGGSAFYANIYKTYVLVVRKDENFKTSTPVDTNFDLTTPPGDYDLRFFTKSYNNQLSEKITHTIDCSDGKTRYYYNIEQDLFYEKGAGLTVDIYACVGGMREFNSSALGALVLTASTLGGR